MIKRQELRFGLAVSFQMMPFSDAVNECQHAEELGYDSIWLADAFQNFMRVDDPMFDAWTTLAALATQTTRLRLGTMVTNFISRNPTLVARQAHSVDHISGGRLELGLGAGVFPSDHTMAGVELWSPGERVDRFREAVHIVDHLLRNEVTTFVGQYYRTKEAVLRPDSIQKPRPPITIAALGDRMLRIAARYADSWNTVALPPQKLSSGQPLTAAEALEEVKRQSAQLDKFCAELGRNPGEIRRSLFAGFDMADNPFESIDAFHEFVRKYQEIGISEFIFLWVPDAYRTFMRERDRTLDTKMVERIALDAIPGLRD
jgi:alkanesulfonate monooxygenase SsuD/methylene tetrahydromethanopterin reductase-like flavin-dependent oxidoreductase (luciferase family)